MSLQPSAFCVKAARLRSLSVDFDKMSASWRTLVKGRVCCIFGLRASLFSSLSMCTNFSGLNTAVHLWTDNSARLYSVLRCSAEHPEPSLRRQPLIFSCLNYACPVGLSVDIWFIGRDCWRVCSGRYQSVCCVSAATVWCRYCQTKACSSHMDRTFGARTALVSKHWILTLKA